MAELTLGDRARHNIPVDGRWFWYQHDMLSVYESQGGICLAWSKKNGAHTYGIYADADHRQIMQILHQNAPDKRWAFELIPSTAVCKAYMDIEWKGELDAEHAGIHEIVVAVRSRCRETYQLNPLIYVCCGSREETNSYHVAIDNLHFESNHDGQMRRFFDFEGAPFADKIDLKVYTANRLFRLPHNCKRTSDVALARISGDPLEDRFDADFGDNIDAVLPFFLAKPQTAPGVVLVRMVAPPPEIVAPRGPRPAVTVAGPRKRRRLESDVRPLPFPFVLIQEMLVQSGDTVSTPTKAMWLDDEQAWQVQCDQGHQSRSCMVQPGKVHAHNNCLIFVTKFKGRFKLKYHCTSDDCGGFAVLGYVAFTGDSEWQYSLSEPNEPEEAPPSDDEPPPAADFDPLVPPDDPDNPAANTYAAVKARFETICFKIREPFMYGRVESDGSLCFHSHVELRQYFCDWTFWQKKDPDKPPAKCLFVDEWLRDPDKRTVHKVVISPKGAKPDQYNLWRGFEAETLPPVDEALEDELIAPIVRHIADVIANGSPSHTRWVLDYLANMVQRPELRSQVAVSLYGLQGCGKGIIFEFFRLKVLGEHCSYQTSKPENDLLGRFANGALNRVLVQVDEVKSLHDYSDRLKDLITNPTLNYEKKGKDTIVVANLTNLVLTSNNANALTVTADDRRYVLFHCSPIYKGDPTYFEELGSHLDRPEVARAFYQHCLKRNLASYPKSFQFGRPITDYYRDAQKNSIPVLSRFLSSLINGSCPETIMSRQFYLRYQTYHTEGSYKFLLSQSSFGRELKKVDGLDKRRTTAGVVYRLDPRRIKNYLIDINEYDEEAEFMP